MNALSQHPVAIVGVGGIFPDALTLEHLWENILHGRSAAGEVPEGRWPLRFADVYDPIRQLDKVYSKRGCYVRNFQLTPEGFALDPDLFDALDPAFHFVLHAARQALRGTNTANLDLQRAGIIIGQIALPTDAASALTAESVGRWFEQQVFRSLGRERPSASSARPTDPLNRYVVGMAAGVAARALRLGGGSLTVDGACAASLYALKFAVEELCAGRADLMLTGGAARPDCLYTQMGFCQLQALSPTGLCAPFDANGNGLVVGEGAGIVALKRLADALRDHDQIYAVIRGIGLSNDRRGNLLAPDSEGQLRAMRAAYTQAQWSPQDLDLIECHATGTPVGDVVEFTSLTTLWGESGWQPQQCVIGSVKSNIGHILTGAGAAGLIKVLLALKHHTLPPTANFVAPAPRIDLKNSPFQVLTASQVWTPRNPATPRRAGISAFGFGGINAHVLIEEWPADRPASQSAANAAIAVQTAPAEPIAVIAMETHVGPWSSLRKFQERVFGGDATAEPHKRSNSWGLEQSDWFQETGLPPDALQGFFIEEVAIPPGQFRIPPKEMEEALPQQLLMLQVAAAALAQVRSFAALSPEEVDERMLHAGVFIGMGLDLNTTNFSFRWRILAQAQEWAAQAGLRLSDDDLRQWTATLREDFGPPLTANRTVGALGGLIASRIAREFHVGGPGLGLSSEETSGLRVVEVAARALQRREIDVAIAGAVDLHGDPRSLLNMQRLRPGATVAGEGAAAVVLKRHSDALRDGDRIYALLKGIGAASGANSAQAYHHALQAAYRDAGVDPATVHYLEIHGSGAPQEDRAEIEALSRYFTGSGQQSGALGAVKADIGHAGAVSGLAAFVKACLCLYHEIIPPVRANATPFAELARHGWHLPKAAQYWLHNRADGPRRAGVTTCGIEGNCVHLVLEGVETAPAEDAGPDRLQPTGARPDGLFVLEADTLAALADRVRDLQIYLADTTFSQIEAVARDWWRHTGNDPRQSFGLACIARDREELLKQLAAIHQTLRQNAPIKFPGHRIMFNVQPVGASGKLAFVFPGSGNHYPGMGREIAAQWPEILRGQDRVNQYLRRQYQPELFWNTCAEETINRHPRDILLGQVAYSTMMTDLLRSFDIRPYAAIGYSLGESSALFALQAWQERDEMLRRTLASPLFTNELAGDYAAARRAWNLPNGESIEWMLAAVQCPAPTVRNALHGRARVYLLIIDTPQSCVIGGERQETEAALHALGCDYQLLQGVSIAHCAALQEAADAYRRLHYFASTAAPSGIAFYSTAWGRAYDVTPDHAADAILAQAAAAIDFPAVIEQAYRDGVRFFLEIGPGNTCTRMIRKILDGRPYAAHSACATDYENTATVLGVLGALITERLPVNLSQLYGLETAVAAHQVQEAAPPPVRLLRVPTGHAAFVIPSPPAPMLDEPQQEPLPDVVPAPAQSLEPGEPIAAMNVAETAIPLQYAAQLSSLANAVTDVQARTARAHQAYLDLSQDITESFAKQAAFQMTLLEQSMRAGLNPSLQPSPQRSEGGDFARSDALRPVPQSGNRVRSDVERRNENLTALQEEGSLLTRAQCLEFAVGSIAKVLGSAYADVDAHPTRVRLPDEPLMLVDRIISVEGEPRTLTHGQVVTEHDIRPDAWYLDCGRIPTCIAVEAGQADLFLSGYLGIDFVTKGLAVYRLLDAEVRFHEHLPGPGTTIRYVITISEFFRQNDTYLFRFHFDATVAGAQFLSMRNGCAGFFSHQALQAGQGLVFTEMDHQPKPGRQPENWTPLLPMRKEAYTDTQLDALRSGDLAACFGPLFEGLPLTAPCRLPGGRMKLIDRVLELDPTGGRYGLGQIRAEAAIHSDDWFLTCHFVDDQVMPGTLMYECSLHAFRVLLMRMGWVGEQDEIVWEPVPGIAGQLKCRGQVIATTQKVQYEIALKEFGFRPEPYALADAIMYADHQPIVRMNDLSLRLSGLTRAKLEQLWRPDARRARQEDGRKPAIFDHDRILEFAIGQPSKAFGDRYAVFDHDRVIARLPGPPYQFLDRITEIQGEPWTMTVGKTVEAQYDTPPEAWYFAANRQPRMPFAVLLEIALQPCGWLAAFAGSALVSDRDLSFRNLGGNATQFRAVTPEIGVLTTRVTLTNVSHSAGMIIQHYNFAVTDGAGQPIYTGATYFGFFLKEALANQVGLREAQLYHPTADEQQRGAAFPYPTESPFPDDRLRMIDLIDLFASDGGPHQLGVIRGVKRVRPDEWFFQAHFYQDPVWPGSLGLEAFVQLVKVVAVHRWGWQPTDTFECMVCQRPQQWTYRGQVIPTDREVTVEAVITAVDDDSQTLEAAGYLIVDGRIIYRIEHFTVQIRRGANG